MTNQEQGAKIFVLGFLCSLFFFLFPALSGEPLYTLSATVSESQPQNSTFSAHFTHPATGEHLEYSFKVTENTGMNGLKNIKELNRNDLLQIDYFKGDDGTLIVEYMARMKMKGAPDGLDEFNPAELLRKANQKN